MRCIRCHRPLKNPAVDGLGPICFAKAGKPIPAHERDLFGYEIAEGVAAATARVRVHVEILAVDALMALRGEFVAARRRLGVWA
jgi:hypothetical protein